MATENSVQLVETSVQTAEIVELDATDWALGPGSVTWRVMRDPVVFLVGQSRTSMLLLLHPPFAASAEHDTFMIDPMLRFRRVGMYAYSATYGTKAEARRLSHMVRTRHGQVKGIEPLTRRPYQSNSEYELALTHVIQASSYLAIYEAAHGTLSDEDRDRYFLEQKIPSALLGINPAYLPSTYAEIMDFMAEARKRFAVGFRGRDLLKFNDNARYPKGTAIGDMPAWQQRVMQFFQRMMVDIAISTLPEEDRLVLAITRPPKLRWRGLVRPSLRWFSAFMCSKRGQAYWNDYLQAKSAGIFRRALRLEDACHQEGRSADFSIPDAQQFYQELPDLKRNWPGSVDRYSLGREEEGDVMLGEVLAVDPRRSRRLAEASAG